MVLLQSYVYVWNISPDVFCRWSSFKVMSLCGVLPHRCSVDGSPSKLCFCAENQSRCVQQMVLLQSYVLCGAFPQRCSVDGPPSKLCFCVEHQPKGVLQMILLQRYVFCVEYQPRCVMQMVLLQGYVFVWSISPEVFCRWYSFNVICLCVEHQPKGFL